LNRLGPSSRYAATIRCQGEPAFFIPRISAQISGLQTGS